MGIGTTPWLRRMGKTVTPAVKFAWASVTLTLLFQDSYYGF